MADQLVGGVIVLAKNRPFALNLGVMFSYKLFQSSLNAITSIVFNLSLVVLPLSQLCLNRDKHIGDAKACA